MSSDAICKKCGRILHEGKSGVFEFHHDENDIPYIICEKCGAKNYATQNDPEITANSSS
ncbi:hypothetical protein KAI46_13475 [bacterium]|nr:hypothetical protein [bacterium]